MDIESYAAMLEAQQADRECSEAYRALAANGFIAGSPEDYALWSLAGYLISAEMAATL